MLTARRKVRIARAAGERAGRATLAAVALACAGLLLAAPGAIGQRGERGHACKRHRWLTVWSVSDATAQRPAGAGGSQSHRMIVSPQRGGSVVRIRFSNRFSQEPLQIAGATVADAAFGAGLEGHVRTIRWHGRHRLLLPPGKTRWSDPIRMHVAARHRLAVSYYTRHSSPEAVHPWAGRTSFLSTESAPNLTDSMDGSGYTLTTDSVTVIDRLQVRAARSWGEIVALGDSITDGNGATPNLGSDWPERLGRRLRHRGLEWTVDNAGINGNLLIGRSPRSRTGPNAVRRFKADVLSLHPRDVIILEGINDLMFGRSADEVIGALKQLLRRARDAHVEAQIATLLPTPLLDARVEGGERRRQKVNRWIRSQHLAPVVDWDRTLRGHSDHTTIRPRWDADSVHPNDRGYARMARTFEARLLPPVRCR